MLDTGLTYALVPTTDVESVAKALMGYSLQCQAPGRTGALGLYKCSGCTEGNFSSLKPIELFIGGKYFDLPVSSYIGKPDENDKCNLLLHPYDTSFGGDSKWVVGAEFL